MGAQRGQQALMAGARRVVLDSNTVLSALLFVHGRLVPLRTAWQSGELTPLLCAQTVEEFLRALAYPKFKLTPKEREELLADYLPYGEVVAPWRTKPAVPECRDEKDQIFLDLAAVGAAQWLVTGDQDLLSLCGQVRFQIIPPATAIELLTSSEP
ncbi:MAG: putative toxin-antitoxin system toxin component, PIN family [Steroidobacteraceae bacterium]